MIRLTEAQQAMLLSAAAREDGAVVASQNGHKAGAIRVATSLVARKLLRAAKTKPGQPIWRTDENGKKESLIITRAGRAAIDGCERAPAACKAVTAKSLTTTAVSQQVAGALTAPRARTKQALLIEMLSSEQGATLAALTDATGWLPHTARAALTGLRKKGFSITRDAAAASAGSAYRIVATERVAQ
jgi:hypothetical protein